VSKKHLFSMALLTRLASLLCLGLFYFCHFTDLEIKTQLLALGLSFTGWLVGSFFLGLYNAAQLIALENEIEMAVNSTLKVVKEVTDDEEKPSHPLFKDDENE